MENNEKNNQQEEETGGYDVETYEPINIKPEEAKQNKECIIKAFTDSSPPQNDNNMNYQNIPIYSNYNTTNNQLNNSQYLYNDQNNINYSIAYPSTQSGIENINFYQELSPTNNQNSYYYQDINTTNYSYPVPTNYGNNYNISEYSYQIIPQTIIGYNNSNYYGSPYRQSLLITQNNVYPSNYGIEFNYTNVYL